MKDEKINKSMKKQIYEIKKNKKRKKQNKTK